MRTQTTPLGKTHAYCDYCAFGTCGPNAVARMVEHEKVCVGAGNRTRPRRPYNYRLGRAA